jgi:ribosomal protein L11
MLVTKYENNVCCKFLIQAGSAETNSTILAVFNQYRSSFYDLFIQDFNKKTQHLPKDLLLLTTVYVPLPGVTVNKVLFLINMPKFSFFLKKLLKIHNLDKKFNLYCLFVSIPLVFKIAVLKSYNLKYKGFDLLKIKEFFKLYHHSLKTYNSVLPLKNFFFSFNYILGGYSTVFYKLEILKYFKHFFK